MRILFVASDRMEFAGLLRRGGAVQRTGVAVDWSRSITLNGNHAMLVANGAGPVRAGAAAVRGIESFQPEAIVSTGFCGALHPALAVAGMVAADRILTDNGEFPARTLPGPRVGPIRSISYVAQTAEEKRRLAVAGAIAVEMEAAGVAAEASRRALPFYCIRAVTDLAGETLANDFNKALRSDGHFDTIRILRVALLHPATRLPELIRLRKRCISAARALGDFLADSRF